MPRRVSILLVATVAGLVATGPADARRRHQIDATPFAHSPCSVLDNRPCTPTVCSPLDHGTCIPEIGYPIGEDLHLTVLSKPADEDAAKYTRPDHDLDTIGDLFAELRSCWTPPPADTAREGMEMSVRFSVKRDGGLVAPPRLTYATQDASADIRNTYRQAIDDSIAHCAPLPLTKGLGGAIAGRPIMVRFVDNRPRETSSTPSPPTAAPPPSQVQEPSARP